nr:hypothetical protein [Tanacetum cinerariifolium]
MTIATTIEQQVALDEALVPSNKRLRIGRSNFRLPSDIQSKESTLQVVYDVLRRSPFFKAFLVTADNIVDLEAFREMLHISPRVPGQYFAELPFEEEILEFLRFLGHSAQIKTLTNVNVNKLFQPWRSFTAVEHKNQKKSNEMYYPRFTKVIIHHFMTKKPSIPRRNKVNWHYVRDDILFSTIKVVSRHHNTQQYGAILPIELTTEDIRNTKAYKEYYACATGEAAPKQKASARKKRGGSDSSTTPPTVVASPRPITTVAVAPRLTAAAKGKQPARAISPTDPSKIKRTEAEQLKIVLKRSRQETHISQHGDFGTDKGTGSKPGVLDVPSDDSKEEISWNTSDNEDVDDQTKGRDDNEGEKTNESDVDDDDQDETEKEDDDNDDDDEEEIAKLDEQEDTESEEEEGFDPNPRTPEDDKDDGNGDEDQGLRISKEERIQEEEEADELYRDVDINQGRGLQVSQDIEDSHMTLTPVQPDGQQESLSVSSFVTSMLNPTSDAGVESIFTTASSPIAPLPTPTPIMTPSTIATITTSKSVNAQLEAEVLTRSSHSSRTSYAVAADLTEMELKKILMEKMEGNKSIQQSDEQQNLYKALRQRKGREHESASTLSEPATRSASRSTIGTQSRQMSVSESAFVEEPVQTTCQIDETPHSVFDTDPASYSRKRSDLISELAKQADSRSSFNKLLDNSIDFSNFIMNRLCVDTLTPKLLDGPTYELMKGSCTSLTELKYHMEEVYKATTDQLDWVNPEGQKYPHNLLQPLSLIPNNRGRRVIPFAHFINNDLEYLQGGTSSQKYTTSVTKTKAADYGLRLQDIEDMLLLLIQGKLSNLTVDERFAFNVSLRMFTRSIVIQRRVKDLQL